MRARPLETRAQPLGGVNLQARHEEGLVLADSIERDETVGVVANRAVVGICAAERGRRKKLRARLRYPEARNFRLLPGNRHTRRRSLGQAHTIL